jgi:hypothetical protein
LIWISICNTIVLTLIPLGDDHCESNIAAGEWFTMRRAERNFNKPKKTKNNKQQRNILGNGKVLQI